MSNIATKCIHEGYSPKNGEARVLPIVQSTTFLYESSEQMGNLFDLKEEGFFYSRIGNPTVDAVEKKIAALEGGVAAMLTSSGQAAVMMAVLNICHSGDHVISSSAIYGGTYNLFNKTLREMGIDITFVSPEITKDEFLSLIKENTKCVYAETISNPSLDVLDIELFASVAHEKNIPLIVDNTFATPVNCRPIEFGADIIVHSTSKYMDGHAVALGGAIVDSGKFDWNASDKFPMFTTPDETYHGIKYVDHFGPAAYIAKARVHLMRDFGATPSPQNAFLLNLGLETLALRVEKHCQNALAVAKFLENNENVSWVNYPALENNKYYPLVEKYLAKGTCGVISFGIKGGRDAAVKFMDSLKLVGIVTHVADLRTCVLHPASTTHRQLNDEQLLECGVSADLIRLSVGIEDIEDILADVKNALTKI